MYRSIENFEIWRQKMLKKLDAWLLKKTQKKCDKIQSVFGILKFTIQKWARILETLFLLLLATLLMMKTDGGWLDGFFTFLIVVFVIYILLRCVASVLRARKEEADFLKSGRLTYSYVHNVEWRCHFLFHTILISPFLICVSLVDHDIALAALLFGLFFENVYIYVSACIPRPPGKSKAQKIIEKMKERLSGVFTPPPVPTF